MVGKFSRYSLSAVSTIGSAVALWAGLSGHGPGPAWMWIVIAYVALAFGLVRLWWDAKKHEPLASAFRKSLTQRCDALIVKWQELDELYRNSPKEVGQPATLQEPMHPGWGSSELKYLPYQVGQLQAWTIALGQDLQRTITTFEEWDARISMPQLLEKLRKYKEQAGDGL